jgi:hypothetical protein
MKLKTLLIVLAAVTVLSVLPACSSKPQCRFCPVGPRDNPFLDLVVDVNLADNRRFRTFRLDFGGCAIGFVADPKKNETCTVTGYRVRRDPGLRNPVPFNLQSPPSSARFEIGTGAELWLDATYALPVVEYWDPYGNYMGSGTTIALAPDGTWMDAGVPDLSGVYSGTYRVEINNIRWDGTRQLVASGNVQCYGRDMRDEDGDGWSPDAYDYYSRDCDDYNPNVNPGAGLDCSGWYYYDQNCNGLSDSDECWGGGSTCCGPGCYCY